MPRKAQLIKRFNRTFRSEALNACLFEGVEEVREVSWWWMIDYNEERPHDALGVLTLSLFRGRLSAETSAFELQT
jgi:putative transposase